MWIVFSDQGIWWKCIIETRRDNNHTKNLAHAPAICHDGVHRGKEVITEGSIHDKDDSRRSRMSAKVHVRFEEPAGG